MFIFPRYLPLGQDSEARGQLAALRHGLDTASPLVVHGLRTGILSEYQGRRFFSLQRDITGLLREVIKNEESTRWQVKHAKAVKNAIRIGFADLDAMYLTLSAKNPSTARTGTPTALYTAPPRRQTPPQSPVQQSYQPQPYQDSYRQAYQQAFQQPIPRPKPERPKFFNDPTRPVSIASHTYQP
ncbi:hypothetical protein FRB99_003640, partial [Tulasnella sp. 403]